MIEWEKMGSHINGPLNDDWGWLAIESYVPQVSYRTKWRRIPPACIEFTSPAL